MAAGRQGGRVWSPGSLPATRSPQAGRSLATATSGPAPQDRRPGPTRNPTAALGRAHLGGGKAGSGRRRHPPTAPGSLGKEKAQGARGVQSAGCWLRGRRSPAEGSALRPGPVLGRAGSARLLPPVPVHTRAVSHLGRVLSGAVQRWRRRHRPGRAPTVLSRRARVTCLYGPPGGPAPDTPRPGHAPPFYTPRTRPGHAPWRCRCRRPPGRALEHPRPLPRGGDRSLWTNQRPGPERGGANANDFLGKRSGKTEFLAAASRGRAAHSLLQGASESEFAFRFLCNLGGGDVTKGLRRV